MLINKIHGVIEKKSNISLDYMTDYIAMQLQLNKFRLKKKMIKYIFTERSQSLGAIPYIRYLTVPMRVKYKSPILMGICVLSITLK